MTSSVDVMTSSLVAVTSSAAVLAADWDTLAAVAAGLAEDHQAAGHRILRTVGLAGQPCALKNTPCSYVCEHKINTLCLRIGLCSVLRPRQHSIGYMGDRFYRSKDPTNSIKVLKEKAVKEKPKKHTQNKNYAYAYTHKIAYKYSIHK